LHGPGQIAARIALLAASIVLALTVGEVLARFLLPPPEVAHVRRDPAAADRMGPDAGDASPLRIRGGPTDEQNSLYVRTPAGKRLRPATTVYIENHRLGGEDVTVRTNAIGYRNREIGGKDRTRVLFLGDSILLADWLAEDQTMVRVVETLSRRGTDPLETINGAVGGVGVANQLAILMETGIGTAPDEVVLGFYLNDVAPSPGVHVWRPPGMVRWSRLAQHLYRAASLLASGERDDLISPETARVWIEEIHERFPPGPGDPMKDPAAFNRIILENFGDWGNAWSDGAWQRMEPILREMKRQADLNGFRLRILCFPVRQQVEAAFVYDHPQQRLAEFAGDLGVPYLDLLPVLRKAHRESGQVLFLDQCHHTAYGNRLVAREVLAFLREGARSEGS
jgi:hypothetical protein